WTEERIEWLKRYHAQGLSCGQIAREMGATRNAVIGKLHRLGLAGPSLTPEQKAARAEASRKERAGRLRQQRQQRAAAHVVELKPREAMRRALADPVLPEVVVASPNPLTLLEVAYGDCRWPLDGGLYCGNPALEHAPYCIGHCRLAYSPASSRSR